MNSRAFPSRLLAGSILAGLLICAGGVWTHSGAQPAAKPATAIPDFSSNGRTWVLASGTAFLKVPGDTGPGPIVDKNRVQQEGGGARTQNRLADTTNPIRSRGPIVGMDIANTRTRRHSVR
jgi:hypothetical protein